MVQKRAKTLLPIWILMLSLTVLVAGSFLTLYFLKLLPTNIYYYGAFGLAFSICLAGFTVTFANWRFVNESLKIMMAENIYNLGKSNTFFDYNTFSKRVKGIQKKIKDQTSYILTFTTSHISMVRNSSRNSSVTELNGYIADFLGDYFDHGKSSMGLKNAAFCFYHNQFVLYVVCNEEQVRELIETIESAIYQLSSENGIKLFIQPFFGFAAVRGGETLQMVLDNAFLARDLGERNFDAITFYNDKFRKVASKSEIQEIKDAIANDELIVYYQPKYNLLSKTFISAEALVRWNSKKYGLVSPARFIEKAELGGLIHEIDMCIFEKVCQDLSEMQKNKSRILSVSVNFSMYEFYSPTFLEDVDRIIKASGINPSMLEIEITETTSQANPFLAISIMKKLKDYGLKILMDDFGIGYSNLGTLSKIPFDTVKIDKSFIDGMISDLKTREIIKFLIALCKTNGMEVIAEGVDKQEQVEILKKLKCDTIQGYFYSTPLPRDEFERFLKENPFEKDNVKKEAE